MVRKLKDDESKGNDFVEGEVFRGRNICEFVTFHVCSDIVAGYV